MAYVSTLSFLSLADVSHRGEFGAIEKSIAKIREQYEASRCCFFTTYFLIDFRPWPPVVPQTAKGSLRLKQQPYDLVEERLPLSGEDWGAVCTLFNERHPNPGRLAEGLRKKFSTLWKKRVRTGQVVPQRLEEQNILKRTCTSSQICQIWKTQLLLGLMLLSMKKRATVPSNTPMRMMDHPGVVPQHNQRQETATTRCLHKQSNCCYRHQPRLE